MGPLTLLGALALVLVSPVAMSNESPPPPSGPWGLIGLWHSSYAGWLERQPHLDYGAAPVYRYWFHGRALPTTEGSRVENYVTAMNHAGKTTASHFGVGGLAFTCILVLIGIPPGIWIDPDCLPVPLPGPIICWSEPPICI